MEKFRDVMSGQSSRRSKFKSRRFVRKSATYFGPVDTDVEDGGALGTVVLGMRRLWERPRARLLLDMMQICFSMKSRETHFAA